MNSLNTLQIRVWYLFQVSVGTRAATMQRRAHVVEDQEETRWFSTFEKLHHNGVIEIIYRRPPDVLGNVFFLKRSRIRSYGIENKITPRQSIVFVIRAESKLSAGVTFIYLAYKRAHVLLYSSWLRNKHKPISVTKLEARHYLDNSDRRSNFRGRYAQVARCLLARYIHRKYRLNYVCRWHRRIYRTCTGDLYLA